MEMMKDDERTELHQYGADDVRAKHPMEEEEDTSKSSICCLQGCLAASAVGFSFFVALPTGILLVVYASNKDDIPLISVGGVLVSLPLIMLLIVIVLCFNQRRLARLGKNRVTFFQKKKTQSSSSSTTTIPATVTAYESREKIPTRENVLENGKY